MIYFTIVIVAIIMCLGFVSGHYSTDDYNIMNIGYHDYSIYFNLVNGRPIMFFIDQIYRLFNINYDVFFISTVVIAIFLTCLNIMMIYQLIEKYINKKDWYIIYIILFFTIFNFMYIESLYFVESCVMALSLVLYTLSAKYFFRNDKYSFLKSFLFNTLAMFCYNAFECYFIILIMFISFMKNKQICKNVFLDVFKAGAMIITTIILNFIQIKTLCHLLDITSTRIQGFSFSNLFIIISNIPKIMIETCNLFPKYLFVACLTALLFLSLIYDKNSWELLFDNLLLSIACILSSFCISTFSLSSFSTGRLSYGVGMTIGIVTLNFFCKIKKNGLLKKALVIFVIFYSLINFFNYYYKTMQSRKLNKIEKNEVINLDKKIRKYEIDNNIVVDKVVLLSDYSGRKVNIIEFNALYAEWSALGVINFYTNRNIKKQNITDEETYEYSVKMKNKEYMFDKDILILRVYDW